MHDIQYDYTLMLVFHPPRTTVVTVCNTICLLINEGKVKHIASLLYVIYRLCTNGYLMDTKINIMLISVGGIT